MCLPCMGLDVGRAGREQPGRLHSPAPSPTLGHLLTCSEDCTVVVDASAGCGGVFPCSINIAITGATEADWDFVSIWRVVNRNAPLAGLSDPTNNRITELSGPLAYNTTRASSTGMFLIRFNSDGSSTADGWAASWRALPPPPGTKFCTNRTLTAAAGTVEDGSGSLPYGNR